LPSVKSLSQTGSVFHKAILISVKLATGYI
jgi:hypothetical protein